MADREMFVALVVSAASWDEIAEQLEDETETIREALPYLIATYDQEKASGVQAEQVVLQVRTDVPFHSEKRRLSFAELEQLLRDLESDE